MDTDRRATILQFLRELGERIDQPCTLNVGRSSSLILHGLLLRATEDIDLADEVPAPIRNNHALLRDLADRYEIALTHFQSHYLPNGWDQRATFFDRFGPIDVRLIDATDLFVSKLFSRRDKDLDDLRILSRRLDRATIEERLRTSAKRLAADPELKDHAERNWRILYGDELTV